MEKTQTVFFLWWILTQKTLFLRNSTASKGKENETATAKLAALNIIVQFICYFHKDKLFSKDKTK